MPDGLRAAASPADLRTTLSQRVVIADGAMGTMLQGYDLTLEDFEQLEGCNEILNVTRPDIVRAIHDAYFEVGVMRSRPTPSAPISPLSGSTASPTGSPSWPRPARGSRGSPPTRTARRISPRWVLGSVGPGTKLPTLGHVSYAQLRDAYQQQVEGLLAGGVDAVLIETVTGSAADQGRHARCQKGTGVRRPRSPGDRACDRRDHGHDAARLRDRCRASPRWSRSAST